MSAIVLLNGARDTIRQTTYHSTRTIRCIVNEPESRIPPIDEMGFFFTDRVRTDIRGKVVSQSGLEMMGDPVTENETYLLATTCRRGL